MQHGSAIIKIPTNKFRRSLPSLLRHDVPLRSRLPPEHIEKFDKARPHDGAWVIGDLALKLVCLSQPETIDFVVAERNAALDVKARSHGDTGTHCDQHHARQSIQNRPHSGTR